MWVRRVLARAMREGDVCFQRRAGGGRINVRVVLGLCMLVSIALAGCRSTSSQPALPGGTYRNDTFHFSVSYPPGWQVNVAPAATASHGIPLHVVITRTSTLQTTNALISNCSIVVLNPRDAEIATQIKPLKDRILSKDTHLHAILLGGQSGYREEPVQQQIPGTPANDTHTNYYLLLSDYVYEISTDAISSDSAGAVLQSMVASFTIVK
ncbi:MAG: hypothetical protein ACXWQ8_05770 [Ktedonobacterales bacterium]